MLNMVLRYFVPFVIAIIALVWTDFVQANVYSVSNPLIDHRFTNINKSNSTVHCISVDHSSRVYSELLVGDVLLASNSLDSFNHNIMFQSAKASVAMRLCVHVFNEEHVIDNNRHDAGHGGPGHAVLTPRTLNLQPTSSGHFKFKTYAMTLSAISSTVYVNTLEDFVVNITACSVSTSSSSTSSCNLRSAIAFCTSTWSVTSSAKCTVIFPLQATIYLDPELGEIDITDMGGSLLLEGNGCTITTESGTATSSRFLSVHVTNKDLTAFHLHVRNLSIDSFGSVDVNGGIVFATNLTSMVMDRVNFVNSTSNNGGSVYVEGCTKVQITQCAFVNTTARTFGGAIYVASGNENMMISNCDFTETSSYYDGGAISVGTANYRMTISNCRFTDTSSLFYGGAISVYSDNDNMQISDCNFTQTFSYNGGAISVGTVNHDMIISNCHFTKTSCHFNGGVLFVDKDNYDMKISYCDFTETLSYNGGGAIYVGFYNDDMKISDCKFAQTFTNNGGAITVGTVNDRVTILDCDFTMTSCHFNGGAIYVGLDNDDMKISYCNFAETSSYHSGGAISVGVDNDQMKISNCNFTATSSDYDGGGISVGAGNDQMKISYCNFTATSSDYDGGGISVDTGNNYMTISKCAFTETSSDSDGGAISVYSDNAHFKIFHSAFLKSTASNYGGAIYVSYDNDNASISSATFTGCSATYGGSLYLVSENDRLKLINVSFVDGAATTEGGAVLLRDSNRNAQLINVEFRFNYAGIYGGAVSVVYSNEFLLLTDCLFYENRALSGGGALFSTVANSNFTIRNCKFEGNRGSSGGSLYFGSDHLGISISGSVLQSSTGDYGGAIYFDRFSSEVSFVESRFESNLAAYQGGAVYSLASDITMTGCTVSLNKADVGSGIYYPSSIDDHNIFISSCFFEKNIASGSYGAIWVESASSVAITSSNFSHNQAHTGSALGISVASSVSIQDCAFVGNIANYSAGAVYLDNSDAVTVNACHFDTNVATFGSGSAIWLTASSDVTIQGNRFIGNSAPNGGGAIFWVVSSGMSAPVGLEDTKSNLTMGNYYEGNVAMYGSNLSTDAFALRLSGNDTYVVSNYDNYIPEVGVYMVDFYDQVVSTVSSGFVVTSVSSTVKCYENNLGYLTGGLYELVDSGLATFRSLDAYCDPGYNMTVEISSESYDVESTSFDLAFRSCVRGEYYQDRICVPCENGTYSTTEPSTTSLSELRNSDVCKECPSGSKDCYGDTILLKEGFWRNCDSSTVLQVCPYGKHACRGGSGSGDFLCRKGYHGPLCAICDNGYVMKSITDKCEACSSDLTFFNAQTILTLIVVVVVIGAVWCLYSRNIKSFSDLSVLIFTKFGLLDSKTANKEQVARFMARRCKSSLKINITMWQTVSIMPFVLDLRFPDAYATIVSALNAVNINVSWSSLVSCSAGRSYDAIDGLVMDTTWPLIVIAMLGCTQFLHLCLKRTRSEAGDAKVKEFYYKTFLVFTYLILPSTCTKIFQVFDCNDVDPSDECTGDDEYMEIDYNVSCSSSKYKFGYCWAIVSILVYPIGIPAYYYYVLYSNREAIQSRDDDVIFDADSKRSELDDIANGLVSIRLLFEEYQPCYWYWEVVETFRRLMLTGLLALIAQGSAVQIIVGICLSIFFLKLYDSFSPYADPIVRTVQNISLRQICVVFFLALLVKADFESVKGSALLVCLVLAVFANVIILVVAFLTWRCHLKEVDFWQLHVFTAIERESEMSGALKKTDHVSITEHLGDAMTGTKTVKRSKECDGVGSEADTKQSVQSICEDAIKKESYNSLSGMVEMMTDNPISSPLGYAIEGDDVDVV